MTYYNDACMVLNGNVFRSHDQRIMLMNKDLCAGLKRACMKSETRERRMRGKMTETTDDAFIVKPMMLKE